MAANVRVLGEVPTITRKIYTKMKSLMNRVLSDENQEQAFCQTAVMCCSNCGEKADFCVPKCKEWFCSEICYDEKYFQTNN